MQKSTCLYLKTKISSIHPTFGFELQHLLNDAIISPFLTLLGQCTNHSLGVTGTMAHQKNKSHKCQLYCLQRKAEDGVAKQ